MRTTLIQGCHVLNNQAPRGCLENQDILIHGQTIEWIQPTGSPASADQVIDGRGMLALPGLINAHTHSPEIALTASSECLPLELWLIQQFAFRANFPPRLIYLLTLAGAAEMLRAGTTAVLDHFWMAGPLTHAGLTSVMQAYADSGMRVMLSPMLEDSDRVFEFLRAANPALQSLLGSSQQPRLGTADLLEITEGFIAQWHGHDQGRLTVGLGPGGLQWCSEQLLTGCRDLAERCGVGLHMHLAETRLQARVCQQVYGRPAALELEALGFLGERTSVAHAIWLDEAELQSLARHRTQVVHNPVSNLKLGSGIAPVATMRQMGIDVALGTDGAASSDNQNMFGVMKSTALLHSPATRSPAWINARQVFAMSTTAGARVLGHNHLGEVQAGWLADLVLLDLSQVLADPLPDAFRHLVFCETGAAVRHVFVNGRLVVMNGELLSQPEGEIRQEARERLQVYDRAFPRPAAELRQLGDEWAEALRRAAPEV